MSAERGEIDAVRQAHLCFDGSRTLDMRFQAGSVLRLDAVVVMTHRPSAMKPTFYESSDRNPMSFLDSVATVKTRRIRRE
jgi:hypothetical protein